MKRSSGAARRRLLRREKARLVGGHHRRVDLVRKPKILGFEVGSPLFTVVTDKAVVDVEDGLVVPVLRDACRLDLALSRVVEKTAQGIPEKNRFGGRGRPRFSRSVTPSYARRRIPAAAVMPVPTSQFSRRFGSIEIPGGREQVRPFLNESGGWPQAPRGQRHEALPLGTFGVAAPGEGFTQTAQPVGTRDWRLLRRFACDRRRAPAPLPARAGELVSPRTWARERSRLRHRLPRPVRIPAGAAAEVRRI